MLWKIRRLFASRILGNIRSQEPLFPSVIALTNIFLFLCVFAPLR